MLSTDTKRLEHAYDVFNQNYFNNTLPAVMITIQSSRGAYGHFVLHRRYGLLVRGGTMS